MRSNPPAHRIALLVRRKITSFATALIGDPLRMLPRVQTQLPRQRLQLRTLVRQLVRGKRPRRVGLWLIPLRALVADLLGQWFKNLPGVLGVPSCSPFGIPSLENLLRAARSKSFVPSYSAGASVQTQGMDVYCGWQVKSNKRKEASSPTHLDKLGRAVRPVPRVKLFK